MTVHPATAGLSEAHATGLLSVSRKLPPIVEIRQTFRPHLPAIFSATKPSGFLPLLEPHLPRADGCAPGWHVPF